MSSHSQLGGAPRRPGRGGGLMSAAGDPTRPASDGLPGWPELLDALDALFVAFDHDLVVRERAGGLALPDGADRSAVVIGRPLREVLPGPFEHYAGQCAATLRGTAGTVETTAGADPRRYEIEFAPVWADGDVVTGGVAVVRAVTTPRPAEPSLTDSTRLFETAFVAAPIGLALVGLDGRFIRVNAAICELLRYSESELLSLTFQEITHADDLDAELRQVERLIAGEADRYTLAKRYLTKDGDDMWTNQSASLVRDEAGRPAHFISQIQDISQGKRLEIALQHLADHDHLTELGNRRAFEFVLSRQIARCRETGAQAALLLLDLDDFKAVNDTHGHTVGDALLVRLAGALRTRLRTSDCIARIGGDEFAVILPDASPEQAAHVAAALAEEIGRLRIPVGEDEIGVTASVGLVYLDENAPDQGAVVAAADRAMYEKKLTSRRRP